MALLEQAFRIKEDIVTNLLGTQGTYQAKTASRTLLENHIQTITSIVKQPSTDIEVLEGQILQWDGISSGTSLAVQNLDHKHLAGIGDLRGRVARCDASISKLSGDVSSSSQEIQKLQKETHDVTSALEMHKELELKITQLLGKMETSVSEQNSNLRAARGDQLHELQLLDVNRTLGALADVREQIHSQRKWAEVQLSRSQQVQTQGTEQLQSLLRERVEMTEKKMQDSKNLLTVRLEKCEERQELEIRANRAKHAEDKLTSRIRKVEKIWEEPEIIKTEYRSGFESIHDAISSLRQINETNNRMHKEKVQKDIKQIRRKLVQLKDV
ncbi:protein FAM81B-like [Polyodon spathula]|uniref:protein FAM81B-like n=1 Tax=Polyodon spathula TaxID=7913 RepID=UPI001B7EF66D|nr:protein FAM81B-like [Polyodon spathula]